MHGGPADYAARRKRNAVLAVVCCIALLGLFVLALGAGRAGVVPSDVIGILAYKFFGISGDFSDMATNIVTNVRLPRVTAALLIGAALAISGASYQGLFKTPWCRPTSWALQPERHSARRWPCYGTSITEPCSLWLSLIHI